METNNNPLGSNELPPTAETQNTPTQEYTPNRGTGFVGMMNALPAKLMGLFKKKAKTVTPAASTELVVNQSNTQGVPQSSTTPSPHQNPHIEVPPALTKNYKKIILLGGGGLIVFVLLATAIVYFMRPKPVAIEPTPTPESLAPIATPIPTKYATDSAVLQIEDNLRVLDQNLGNTDLNEDTIKPRSLDFNVSFR